MMIVEYPQKLGLGATVSFEHEGGFKIGRLVGGRELHSTGDFAFRNSQLVLCRGEVYRVWAEELKPYPSEPIPEPTK